ncbi:MAG TPA: hypothetical protein VF710_18155 [Longimicrobium sp.]|jgi:hypothetical protein
MSDDFTPETEPSGALVPPTRLPPTAVGVMTPEPEPAPHAHYNSHARIPSPAEVLRPAIRAVAGALRAAAKVLERL